MKTSTKVFVAIIVALMGTFWFYTMTHQQAVKLGDGSGRNLYTAVPTNASSTAGTTSSLVSATSSSRQYYQVTNNTAAVVYLSIGAPAVIGKGISLPASGGTWKMETDEIFTSSIYSISTATGSISILEAK